jgi:type IV secretion system protein VirB11
MKVDDFGLAVKQDKWLRNLEDDMNLILPYIDNRNVTDIAIGHGGELIVEGIGMDKQYTGIMFDEATTTRIIYASAAVLGITIDNKNPIVEGTLKLSHYKIRFEGILPPRSAECPMIFIRRPSNKIFLLEEYLEQGRISQDKYDLLVSHIKKRSNIVVGGATGSGKTTLVNAIIAKMQEFTPDDRFYIVEDAGEIQCTAKDVVSIWAEGEDTLKAVRIALRCHVNRIIFGELRYGSTTNELLKAWNSGHTGNITTIHADSAILTIEKLRSYLREVILGDLPDIAQSVQLVVHMIPTRTGPLVNEIVETHQATSSHFLEQLEENGLL